MAFAPLSDRLDQLPLLLCGPVLRRTEPRSVSVWVALKKACTVEFGLWLDHKQATGDGLFGFPNAVHLTSASTIKLGEFLHVALITIDDETVEGFASLIHGQLYSYNLTFEPAVGEKEDLNTLGLLEGTSGLGYRHKQFPSFVLAPFDLEGLKFAHGSCRKAQGQGQDALAGLDTLIEKTIEQPQARLHQLFLTGDQIYADDVSRLLLPYLTDAGNTLLGITESLPIVEPETERLKFFPVTQENFPAGRRFALVTKQARFSGAGQSHLISFAEYITAYLFYFSEVLWPENLMSFDDFFAIHSALPEETDSYLSPFPSGITDDMDQLEREKTAEEGKKSLKKSVCGDRLKLKAFRTALPKVRRALANVPVLMIFDDHEVTDDWNLTGDWRNKVYTSPLGITIMRNALLAYAVFQAWGNDPVAYREKEDEEPDPQAVLLKKIPELINSFATQIDELVLLTDIVDHIFTPFVDLEVAYFRRAKEIDILLGFDKAKSPPVKWHYSVPIGPTLAIVLDTRTRRDFKAGRFAPPGLMHADAIKEQIALTQLPEGMEVVILVSAAPVLGLAPYEELGKPIGSRVYDMMSFMTGEHRAEPETQGYEKLDIEDWYLQPFIFENLLERCYPLKKVIILSGDVHYGFSSALDYWKKGEEDQPSRFVQLVSSALRNEKGDALKSFVTSGYPQILLSEGFDKQFVALERLGWKKKKDIDFNQRLRPKFNYWLRKEPVLLSLRDFPDDALLTAEAPPPDWAWRLNMLIDQRQPAERPHPEIDPGDVDPLEATAGYLKVFERHVENLKNKVSRRVVWYAHIATVSLQRSEESGLSLTHDMLYFHPHEPVIEDPQAYTSFTISLEPAPEAPPGISREEETPS